MDTWAPPGKVASSPAAVAESLKSQVVQLPPLFLQPVFSKHLETQISLWEVKREWKRKWEVLRTPGVDKCRELVQPWWEAKSCGQTRVKGLGADSGDCLETKQLVGWVLGILKWLGSEEELGMWVSKQPVSKVMLPLSCRNGISCSASAFRTSPLTQAAAPCECPQLGLEFRSDF